MNDIALKDVLLYVENLEVTYQRVILAVQGVSFQVPAGSIVAILGSNGAGKTTVLRAISGFLPSEDVEITNGVINYCGDKLNGTPPHQAVKKGIVLVPEREKIFTTLTVKENLKVTESVAQQKAKRFLEFVYQYFPVLKEREQQVAGYLSGGERQMLGISRALGCSPKLLMIDEMSLGLAPLIASELFQAVRTLNQKTGLTVLLVEQNAAGTLAIADYVYIIEGGKVVFKGTPKALMQHEDARKFYLGMGEQGVMSYREVKQYRRSRRWW